VAVDKLFYNEASATKLGWDPTWFGCLNFDEDLVNAIKKWQRKNGIVADGLCGPTTFRRVWTDREDNISDYKPKRAMCGDEPKYIVHNGEFFSIKWDKVVLWDAKDGLTTKEGNYSSYAGKPDRKPSFFVNHWDVCLSAESCANVLERRGISVHFCIDNDGTIYQLLDTQHAAWQAGGRNWNHKSIGVEISNAYYLKYQNWYVRNGFGERPIQENAVVHGKTLKPFTDFYPVQLQALKALWQAIHDATGIPMKCPTDVNGELVAAVHDQCAAGTFEGFINHYNLTNRKIDCAGLDLVRLLKEAEEEKTTSY
jgi:hypothetical protein